MSSGIKTVKKLKFKDFIDGSVKGSSPRLKIPDFQRNYVWKNKQINELLNSIDENDLDFYIGNFVIKEGNGAGESNLIVDGQQRIITISFVLAAILRQIKEEDLQREIEEMLFVNSSSRKPRLSFSRKGMDKIYKRILDNKDIDPLPDDKILRTVISRFKTVQTFLKGRDVKDLVKKIRNLELITINCSSEHNVAVLYQGLNSTSKKLEPAELIKSLIVGSSLNHNKLWEDLESEFAKRNPIWLDKFFRHHWFSIGGYTSNEDLYIKVRKEFSTNKNYLKDLEDSSKVYLNLRDVDFRTYTTPWKTMRSTDEIKFILNGIRSLRLDQVYAPLMALLKYGTSEPYYLTNTLFFDDLSMIWSFLLLFKFSNSNPNKPEKIFAKFCKDICAGKPKKSEFEKLRVRFYKELTKEAPTKAIFVKNLIKAIKYSTKPPIGDRELVKALLSIYLLNEEGKLMPETCDIEHIFPQGSDYSKWKISKKAVKALVDDQLRYTIGNLTLLKPGDNKTAKVSSFVVKYNSVYKKDRNYRKNQRLNLYSFDSKNPQNAVAKRGVDIASFIYDTLLSNLKGTI